MESKYKKFQKLNLLVLLFELLFSKERALTLSTKILLICLLMKSFNMSNLHNKFTINRYSYAEATVLINANCIELINFWIIPAAYLVKHTRFWKVNHSQRDLICQVRFSFLWVPLLLSYQSDYKSNLFKI